MVDPMPGLDPASIHLAVFLSRATPLSRWDSMGILGREVAIYRWLSSRLGSIRIVTSGGEEELAYQSQLGGIQILYNRWGLSPNVYSLMAPLLHWSELRRATIYKTNQPDGSWTGVLAGMVHRKPVIVRAGYLWAETYRQDGGRGLKAALIDRLQAFSFGHSDAIVLTTQAMKNHVVGSYDVPANKVRVIPNYVDTSLLRPMPGIERQHGRICFVGRLHPCKNLDLLIRAVAQEPLASLVLIGGGEQRAELEKLAGDLGANVRFAGVLAHEQIPLEINQSEIFVLPSAFEGHPKALIEAMSCGIAVIGTDVQGIRDIVKHDETGLLCAPTVDGIRDALHRLLGDGALRTRLGEAARAFVECGFGLREIAERELAMMQQIQGG